MSAATGLLARTIWATRGRSWDFTFLLDGGLADPLLEYERAFDGMTDSVTAWRVDRGCVALRFPDPDGRRDIAKRVIPHEFVVLGASETDVDPVEAGLRELWPLVAGAYASFWDVERAPSGEEVRRGLGIDRG